MQTERAAARTVKAYLRSVNSAAPRTGKVGRPEIVVYCNDQSLTLREWSHQRGIGVEVIRTRLRLGWSAAQALEFEEGPKPGSSATRGRKLASGNTRPAHQFGRLHTLKLGARSRTVQDWSDERGLPVDRVVRRLNVGWSPEEALGSRKRVPNVRMFACAGRCQPLRQWCQERGLPEDRVLSRLRLGWSPEEALGLVARPDVADGPAGPTRRPRRELPRIEQFLTHNGETKTLREWARSEGIAAGSVQTRIRDGWTIAQALGFEERPRGPSREGNFSKPYP